MDWLMNHHAMIVCDEKIVRIPYGDKVLIVQGNRSDKGKKLKLSIISCTKTQKYIKKGCLIFLARITKKETEEKSKEKQLEDVPSYGTFWSQKDNRGQQPPNKRQNVRGQNVTRSYTAGNNERRVYNRLLPLCNKCKFNHEGPCTVRCGKCKKVGHLTRDYKAENYTTSNQRGQVVNQRVLTCFEYGRQGHYKSDCLKLKDQNRGNKTGNKNGVGEAKGKAYVLGADQSFMLTTFSTLLNIITDTLDVSYDVELADGRISLLRGCTLGFLGHPVNINLMPVELGSFDVIIDMDWLMNHHAMIVCDEKIVRIPYGDKVLIVQ
nr:hypothetical protein [Tanacetum cinerariifolium]